MRLLSFDVGLRHLAFADVTLDDAPAGAVRVEVHGWDVLDVTGGERMTQDAQATALVAALASLTDPAAAYDAVLIENQLGRANPRMRAVAALVHGYFATTRHYVPGSVGAVHLVAAARLAQSDALFAPADASASGPPGGPCAGLGAAYRARKAASIAACARFLTAVGLTDRAAQLRAARKGDDLADCMLQAERFWRRLNQPPGRGARRRLPAKTTTTTTTS